MKQAKSAKRLAADARRAAAKAYALAVGNRIRMVREMRNMSVRALALLAGVNAMAVSRWENGTACPKKAERGRIADELGVPAGWLFQSRDEPFNDEDEKVRLNKELAVHTREHDMAEKLRAERKAALDEEMRLRRIRRESEPHALEGRAPKAALRALAKARRLEEERRAEARRLGREKLAEVRRRESLSPDEQDEEDFHRAFMDGVRKRDGIPPTPDGDR